MQAAGPALALERACSGAAQETEADQLGPPCLNPALPEAWLNAITSWGGRGGHFLWSFNTAAVCLPCMALHTRFTSSAFPTTITTNHQTPLNREVLLARLSKGQSGEGTDLGKGRANRNIQYPWPWSSSTIITLSFEGFCRPQSASVRYLP